MAAQVLAEGGCAVDVYDAMPSVGRKFLLAGKGGLNLTHAEIHESFLSRYGSARTQLQNAIEEFGPDALRDWARQLGVETFVGTSGRVFPTDMKAAPLLRAWLHRLRHAGVTFHMRHRWVGWRRSQPGASLVFATPEGEIEACPAATVLALGGASWPRLGSDGAWVGLLESQGIAVAPLRSANCGFDVAWSETFRTRYAGHPVKTVAVEVVDESGVRARRMGELVITAGGIEGSVVYALAPQLREAIEKRGEALLWIDLAPDRTYQRLSNELTRPRGSSSWSRHLERTTGLRGVKLGLVARGADAGSVRRYRRAGCRDQSAAYPFDRCAAHRGSHQQCRWRQLRCARSTSDGEGVAWDVLCRRNARLGGTDRGLPADSLLRDRKAGGSWCLRMDRRRSS